MEICEQHSDCIQYCITIAEQSLEMESPGLTRMVIEGLPVVVSEAQVRQLIRSDNLPRPAQIVLRKSSDSATAVLHFKSLLEALKFRNKKNGKFLSSKTNITVETAPIITSTVSLPPVLSAPVEESNVGFVNSFANITTGDNWRRNNTNISVKTESILDSPVYETASSENSPVYEAGPYDPEEDIEKNILTGESETDASCDAAPVSISPQQLETNLTFLKVISDPGEMPYDPAERIDNWMEPDKPDTKPRLNTIKVRTNLTAPETPSDVSKLSRTPSTPRSPADSDQPSVKVEAEEDVGPEPAEVVLVNFHFSPEQRISQIRVYLVNIKKHQNFYGKEPAILVGGLLRYIKKYHPLPGTETKMVLVTPCVFSYGAFYSALSENPENKKIYHSYFSHWLDLQSLNNNYCEKEKKLKMVKGVKLSSNKVRMSSLHQSFSYY